MKKAIAITLLLIGGIAQAQNPTGWFPSDRTTSGETINFVGGTAPFRMYEADGFGGWDLRATSAPTETFIVVDWQAPNSEVVYRVTGDGVSPNNGINVTVFSNPVSSGPFLDVPENYWAVDQIQWFKDSGITSGCGNGNYCPEGNVTRAQMAVFFCNYHRAFVDPQSTCNQ